MQLGYITIVTISFIFLPATITNAAAEPTRSQLEGMLPDAYEGFNAERNPMFCVGTVNLTFIHNGGYLSWVDKGVQTALIQTFTKDSSYYSATLYGMNSRANASAIINHFKDQTQGNDISLGEEGFEHSGYGMNYIYLRFQDVFITLEGTGTGSMEAMRKSAEEIHRKAMPEPISTVIGLLLLAVLRRRHGETPLQ